VIDQANDSLRRFAREVMSAFADDSRMRGAAPMIDKIVQSMAEALAGVGDGAADR